VRGRRGWLTSYFGNIALRRWYRTSSDFIVIVETSCTLLEVAPTINDRVIAETASYLINRSTGVRGRTMEHSHVWVLQTSDNDLDTDGEGAKGLIRHQRVVSSSPWRSCARSVVLPCFRGQSCHVIDQNCTEQQYNHRELHRFTRSGTNGHLQINFGFWKNLQITNRGPRTILQHSNK
jgi:hypothetical protein